MVVNKHNFSNLPKKKVNGRKNSKQIEIKTSKTFLMVIIALFPLFYLTLLKIKKTTLPFLIQLFAIMFYFIYKIQLKTAQNIDRQCIYDNTAYV